MGLLTREMAEPVGEIRRLAAELRAICPAAPDLFGGRFAELIDILGISVHKLDDVAAQAPTLLARMNGDLRDDDVHLFRHDLLTPIGTVRGVAKMLARADVSGSPGMPPDFAARAQALIGALSELKDVLDALTDVRGRESEP
jgi:hypothetical protein